MSHTPGPWHVASRRGGWDGVTAKDETDICAIEYNSADNARLISAAPELLAALTGMLAVYWGDGDGQLPEPMVIQEAKAAIEKATAVGLITGKL